MAPLQERFAAAKAQRTQAEADLKAVLLEMVGAGLAKTVEDQDGECPDIIIVAPKPVLDMIAGYVFDETGPTWLDTGGEELRLGAHETVEWF